MLYIGITYCAVSHAISNGLRYESSTSSISTFVNQLFGNLRWHFGFVEWRSAASRLERCHTQTIVRRKRRHDQTTETLVDCRRLNTQLVIQTRQAWLAKNHAIRKQVAERSRMEHRRSFTLSTVGQYWYVQHKIEDLHGGFVACDRWKVTRRIPLGCLECGASHGFHVADVARLREPIGDLDIRYVLIYRKAWTLASPAAIYFAICMSEYCRKLLLSMIIKR